MNLALRLLPLLMIAACSPSEQAAAPEQTGACNRFALSLLQQTAERDKGNICLCPYSAAMAFSLLQPGASDTTHKELSEVLGNTSNLVRAVQNSSLYLETANRILVDSAYSLSPSYVEHIPKGSAVTVDFRGNPEQSRIEINQWVEEETHGLIRDLLAPGQISAETGLAAMNTVYLKNRWEEEFDGDFTHDAPFTLEDGTVKQVSTMHQTNDFPCIITEEYSAITLPFVTRFVSDTYEALEEAGMIFILPPEGVSIDDFVKTLTPDKLHNIQKALRKRPHQTALKKVELSLPRFQTSADYDLIPILKATGLHAAFSPRHGFPGIIKEQNPLNIDSFIQKCSISIDEEGAEAASASVAVPACGIDSKLQEQPIPFHLNRPFLWLVVPAIQSTRYGEVDIPSEYYYCPIFMGIVREPHFPANAPKKRKKRMTVIVAPPPAGIDLPDDTLNMIEGLATEPQSAEDSPAYPLPH